MSVGSLAFVVFDLLCACAFVCDGYGGTGAALPPGFSFVVISTGRGCMCLCLCGAMDMAGLALGRWRVDAVAVYVCKPAKRNYQPALPLPTRLLALAFRELYLQV